MSAPAILLHPSDTVAIALRDLAEGEELADLGITTSAAVARGHKLALRDIALGTRATRGRSTR
jgi:hypothetical protein